MALQSHPLHALPIKILLPKRYRTEFEGLLGQRYLTGKLFVKVRCFCTTVRGPEHLICHVLAPRL